MLIIVENKDNDCCATVRLTPQWQVDGVMRLNYTSAVRYGEETSIVHVAKDIKAEDFWSIVSAVQQTLVKQVLPPSPTRWSSPQ